MKKVFLLMLTISTLLSACKKDKVNGGNMSYKVDGILVTTKSHNASYGNLLPAFMTTNITSSMHTDKRSVNININAVKTGTYNFVSNTSTAILPTAFTIQIILILVVMFSHLKPEV
ncbi:MAG: hypothetical protein R2807_00435 [Chitinophagales bacterium]